MATILTILCSLYTAYGTAFCCKLGYTLYNEHKEKKKKKKKKIKLEYKRLQMNFLISSQNEKMNYGKSSQNEKLQSIVEEDEFIDSDDEFIK
tara:strand:+ start:469 stop:744 length:276 start_codon:yes stop_codon:yes gene_type:complete